MSEPVPPEPQHGGSFVRDAESGAIQCVERSLTAAEREALDAQAAPPAEPPAPPPAEE